VGDRGCPATVTGERAPRGPRPEWAGRPERTGIREPGDLPVGCRKAEETRGREDGWVVVIVLVLGGTRSGKSEVAEEMALRFMAETGAAGITYVATAKFDGTDVDFAARIALHRARRPSSWLTAEVGPAGDLPAALDDCPLDRVALVDSIGIWLAGLSGFLPDSARLTAALARRSSGGARTVLVSDEVGLGVHPETAAGREFRDALGSLNRELATAADEVFFVVAGWLMSLQRPDEMVQP
jgi:adenosylcobinamide kinase/adenosylcobinamide-phosphate guanylyltransferase